VVIRASSSRQVDALLADLASPDDVTRDAAVARLIVIGPRAVQRLLDRAEDRQATEESRVAALHALEGIADQRAFEPALGLLDDPSEAVAAAAVGLLHGALASARGVEALDRLTAIAVDRTRARAVRLAAIRAVRGIGDTTVGPLLQALGVDPDPAIALAAGLGPESAADPVHQLRDAAAGILPDAPDSVRLALTEAAEHVPPQVLHQLIERIRFREGAESGATRGGWMAARAAAHAALAHRGSRLALYDLRETLESARDPLPVEFLGAAAAIGDATCLEAIASAYTRGLEGRADVWWLQRLTDVFRTIAAREGLTRRHAAGKRIAARWREASVALWP
jgi:hypothetical protein